MDLLDRTLGCLVLWGILEIGSCMFCVVQKDRKCEQEEIRCGRTKKGKPSQHCREEKEDKTGMQDETRRDIQCIQYLHQPGVSQERQGEVLYDYKGQA